MPDELIPIFAIMMVFGIPMVAILTAHQRKMAELIHGKQQQANDLGPLVNEVQALRQEVYELRQRMNEQQIALDDLRDSAMRGTPPTMAERLSEGQS